MPEGKHISASDPEVEKDVNRYYTDCMANGKNSKEYCARVAWNIVCANKHPDYPGCTEFGKTWGPPYSSPKGEAAAKPFSHLMGLVSEQVLPDGEVRRQEFEPKPTSATVATMTSEERAAVEAYVLSMTPTSRRVMMADGRTAISYYDSRGRSVIQTMAEMTPGELFDLATRMGYGVGNGG